jgi:predicted phage terminase large subunit-like protein
MLELPADANFGEQHLIKSYRKLCSEDLYRFTRYFFRCRYKSDWVQNWHHQAICDKLMKVINGDITRLIINLPPRYGKTELAVINFIAYGMAIAPDSEFITVSFSAGRAVNSTYMARNIVMMPEYQALFPETQVSKHVKGKGEWHTTAGGIVYGASADGTITGFGAGKKRDGFAGALIIDDPHKANEAGSDVMRPKVNENYNITLANRLNKVETPIILIMQRLHEDDMTGFLLADGDINGDKWEHLVLPALDEQTGEALWPKMHTAERLQRMAKAKPYIFSGQYQQRPAPLEGGIFKTSWWQYYNPKAAPRFRRIILSWDTAFKTGQENDYSCCTVWGEAETGYYLIDIWKEKVEAPVLKQMAVSMYQRVYHNLRASGVLIEDKASGQGLIQELKRETNMPVIPIQKGKGQDKVELANLVAPIIQSGRVFLPEGHPEVAGFVLSHAQFPNAAHDDDVDSGVQALLWFSQGQQLRKVQLTGW